ncbi:MAG: hypothetical protein Q9220_001321 [cf. Caloplaca sp. 1 TL-2023]
MAELLVPLSTTKISHTNDGRDISSIDKTLEPSHQDIQSADHVLNILKSQPRQEALLNVLIWLRRSKGNIEGFNIHGQTPQASQIIHSLVNDVLSHHWRTIRDDWRPNACAMQVAIRSLHANVVGISIVVARLSDLLQRSRNPGETLHTHRHEEAAHIADTLSLLDFVLYPTDTFFDIWTLLHFVPINPVRASLLWKELVPLLGGGRVLSVASEANDLVSKSEVHEGKHTWLSDNSKYCYWVGRNLDHMCIHLRDGGDTVQKAWAQMLERALSIGHVDQVVHGAYDKMLFGIKELVYAYRGFTSSLRYSAKKTVIHSLLRILAKAHFDHSEKNMLPEGSMKKIGGTADLLQEFLRDQKDSVDIVMEWVAGDSVVQSLEIRRAVIAVVAQNVGLLRTAFSNTLSLFGDKLYIKHTPILNQDGMTENLLLLSGCMHRTDHEQLVRIARSSLYLNAVSNRLASSSPRASVLGMYLGTAISELVDPPDKRMNFESEEMTNTEGQRLLGLTKIQDQLGSMEDLRSDTAASNSVAPQTKQPTMAPKGKPRKAPNHAPTTSKIVSIEEIDDEAESEDEDLPTYAKPDSDPSDSDEDPTVIERDKPNPPVYINELISGLRDTDNYDRHVLALTHASPLIRRKAAFGTEVADNTEDLASILLNLDDKWDLDNFQELRLQAMIAVLIAQPLEMGQWFSRAYFSGEHSISQRSAILTTLGLGARELAGYGSEDSALTKSSSKNEDSSSFPSQHLPPKLHKLYSSSTKEEVESSSSAPLLTASSNLESSILHPLALKARDTLSGPAALKIRTFSSRIAVEAARTKPIPNALAKVVAQGFFFPLTARFQNHVQAFGDSHPLTHPPLLSLLLRTLALTLHAAGSSTLALPLMTTECLALLLSLRSKASSDNLVLEAWLFATLTLLQVNGDREGQRRLAEENGKEVVEVYWWVIGLDGGEGRGEALRAGVVGMVRGVMESEERVLMGMGI